MKRYRFFALLLLGLACAACSASPQTVVPTPAVPTPTIAAAPIAATSQPRPTMIPVPNAPVQPTVTPTIPSGPTTTATFTYLWPSYLPDAMAVSPSESRVPSDNEIGTTATGFYAVTFNGGDRKISLGGGATDTLPLTGETREVSLDTGSAILTTNGEQRQLVLIRDRAKYFVYGRNISEQELLLVANSLLPTDVAALRDIVGSSAQ